MLAPLELPNSATQSTSTSLTLRRLRTATPLTATSHTQRTRLLAALGRISSVRIRSTVKEDGHRFYVVEIQRQYPSLGAPSSIKWRFADFLNLRDELYYHVRDALRRHQKRPCEFCKLAMDALDHAPPLPGLHQLIFSCPETVCALLERFANAALQLALAAKHYRELAWCPGLGMVPLLVKRFFLGKGEETEEDASVSPRSACRVDPFRPVSSVGLAFS